MLGYSTEIISSNLPNFFREAYSPDQGTCFEIYKYQDSYIIHGELEISRLDKDGKILWQRSGADIFTTQDGKDDFRIMKNYILATDWENRKYKFDFNGNILP